MKNNENIYINLTYFTTYYTNLNLSEYITLMYIQINSKYGFKKSISQISYYTKLSERQIKRILKSLYEKDYIYYMQDNFRNRVICSKSKTDINYMFIHNYSLIENYYNKNEDVDIF